MATLEPTPDDHWGCGCAAIVMVCVFLAVPIIVIGVLVNKFM